MGSQTTEIAALQTALRQQQFPGGPLTEAEAKATYAAAAEVDVSKYASPQAAVDAAQALGTSVVVKFGKGTFTTTAPITVPRNPFCSIA